MPRWFCLCRLTWLPLFLLRGPYRLVRYARSSEPVFPPYVVFECMKCHRMYDVGFDNEPRMIRLLELDVAERERANERVQAELKKLRDQQFEDEMAQLRRELGIVEPTKVLK